MKILARFSAASSTILISSELLILILRILTIGYTKEVIIKMKRWSDAGSGKGTGGTKFFGALIYMI